MAAPNLLSPTTITGKSVTVDLSTTSATSILSNASGSGKVLKVNMLYVSYVGSSAASAITINYYPIAGLGGTPSPVCAYIPVPPSATLVVIDKDSYIYLEENTSLGAISQFANFLKVFCSYEEIS
jgi:hypothetical protein